MREKYKKELLRKLGIVWKLNLYIFVLFRKEEELITRSLIIISWGFVVKFHKDSTSFKINIKPQPTAILVLTNFAGKIKEPFMVENK